MARFLPIFEAQVEEDRYLRRTKRFLRDEINSFDLPDKRFIELYRFDNTLMRSIIDVLEPHMVDGLRGHKIAKETRILVAMRLFAQGSYQRCVGQDSVINLCQSQVSLAIAEVSTLIDTNMSHWINFPGQMDYATIRQRFMQKFDFPGIIGCVDGTHVAIFNPGRDIEHNYLNRKGFHSENVLIICDDKYKILSIKASHPSATHDAFVWRASRAHELLRQRFEQGNRNAWLLGDSAYSLEPFLLTPIKNLVDDSPESPYNRAHKRARGIVEHCIGLLKTRFRCLLGERTLKYSPRKVGNIIIFIISCAILHNIMIL